MNNYNINGQPFWLSAYPNEGTLDYFGYRFYRQPLRAYLVRGAAANNFKNAKSLIFYAAISYAYREEHTINIEVGLTDEQQVKWCQWFKVANYLYVLNYYSKYKEVPDSGFTGANEEYHNHFKEFYTNENENSSFDIKTTYDRFYPEQRQWGYLAQFWRPPLAYFRCVLDMSSCTPGEYAKDCYEMLSSYQAWGKFKDILNSGIVDQEGLAEIQDVIDCKELSESEKSLAKRIIFDKDNITDGENDEYKKSFNLLDNLKNNGCDNFYPADKNDYTMVMTYAHLKNMPLGENDLSWKILISSIAFEIGLNRLYTCLTKKSKNGAIDVETFEQEIRESTKEWMEENGFKGTVANVEKSWSEKHLVSIESYSRLFDKMLDYGELSCYLDGLLQGYMISKVKIAKEDEVSNAYQALTDKYHYFAPQPFFENKKISEELEFEEFILKVARWVVDEQLEFSLDRMNLGQKAKFILTKSEFCDEYLFQVDAEEFHENRGIVEMIDSCLNLWRTAGIF